MRASYSVIILALALPSVILAAPDVETLRNQINDRNTEIKKLEQEIASYQQELDKTAKQSNTLKNEVAQLNATLKTLNSKVALTSVKIAKTNLDLEQIKEDIGDKQSSIEQNQEIIRETMRQLRQNESDGAIEMVLTAGNLADFWRQHDRLADLGGKIVNYVTNLRSLKTDLETKHKDRTAILATLAKLKAELADQQKIVDQNKTTKSTLLAQTKNQEANYKVLIANRQKLADDLEAELRDYESQLKFTLDPKSLPASGSGPLGWPLTDIFITQLFGKTIDSARLYASGSHSGVDFRASVGTPVFAMADGTVLGTGDTDTACPRASFGKWVLVKYNNGLAATFAHLSLIKARVGETVGPNSTIGYSGNTGRTTGPHLHITVYASAAVAVATKPSVSCRGAILTQPLAPINAYLDPMLYLPKT